MIGYCLIPPLGNPFFALGKTKSEHSNEEIRDPKMRFFGIRGPKMRVFGIYDLQMHICLKNSPPFQSAQASTLNS